MDKKFRFSTYNDIYLNSIDIEDVLLDPSVTESDPYHKLIEDFHPLTYMSKMVSNDTPNWNQAMNGPQSAGYWKACEIEVDTLTKKDAWKIVDRDQGMNVLPSTWSFKCKRFPDGTVKKLKARFCVRGDKQIEGKDYFETYAPVVSWATVRLLLILSVVMNWVSVQVDYTDAFIQAPIDCDVFVEMPRGFLQKGKVLHLNKGLYGLCQSSRNFFLYLKQTLEKCGMKQRNDLDPCLFIGRNTICLVYVDDCIFFSPSKDHIDKLIIDIQKQGMDLHEEDNFAGFLGVDIQRKDNNSLELLQLGLTKKVIEALGLSTTMSNRVFTPSEKGALIADENGDRCQESYSYPSIIGMLMYLAANSRPDIAFAVHQCARFTHRPRRIHEAALKRIGRYLVGTCEKGLILKPLTELSLDCHVDADFAGLWGTEDPESVNCFRSRSGYIFTVAGCPVIWKSKLQSEVALSTMQAEYIALSMSLRDLIPFQHLLRSLIDELNRSDQKLTTIRKTVWEDNVGALNLANMEPGRTTTRSKHFCVKYHWFREKLGPLNIQVKKIDSKHQLADILTEGLTRDTFEYLRKSLSGW